MTDYTFETCGAIDTVNKKPVYITSYFKLDSNFSNIRSKNMYWYFKVANPSKHYYFYVDFYIGGNLYYTVGPLETPDVGYGYWYWWWGYWYNLGGPGNYKFNVVDKYGNIKCSRTFYVGHYFRPGESFKIKTELKNTSVVATTFRVEISYEHPYFGWYTYYFDIFINPGDTEDIIKTIILPSTWTPEVIAWFPVNITIKKDGNILDSKTVNYACAIVKTNA